MYTQNEYQYGIGDKCIQIYIIVSIIHYIVLVFRHACTEFVGLFIMYIKTKKTIRKLHQQKMYPLFDNKFIIIRTVSWVMTA